jgi:hypothetical protein
VRGDEKEPPTVRLVPTGTVTGRVLDIDGLPRAGVEIGFSFPNGPASELFRQMQPQRAPLRTDKDGRFRLEGAIPDLKFGLSMNKGREYYAGEPRLGLKQVGSGKTLDLGEFRTRPAQ